jgi:peroxiredoxin
MEINMRFALLTTLLLLIAPVALAKTAMPMDPTSRGPAIGTAIPSDLASTDQSGMARNFDNLKDDKGLVLVFYRSAKWCPYCKRQLLEIAKNADQITSRGYALAALSYDKLDTLKRYTYEHDPGFVMLSDPKSVVIDAFGIRNEKYGKMHFAYGVPHPMIFVIGPDGKIEAKLAEEGYKKRPPVSAVVEAIDALSTSVE